MRSILPAARRDRPTATSPGAHATRAIERVSCALTAAFVLASLACDGERGAEGRSGADRAAQRDRLRRRKRAADRWLRRHRARARGGSRVEPDDLRARSRPRCSSPRMGRCCTPGTPTSERCFQTIRKATDGPAPARNFWRVVRLLPNGDLIGIWELYGLFKLDRASNVVWSLDTKAHHDLQITSDGRIHHLEAARRQLPEIPGHLAIDDFVVEREADGTEIRRLAISDALRAIDWTDLRRVFWERNHTRGYGLDRARSIRSLPHQLALRAVCGRRRGTRTCRSRPGTCWCPWPCWIRSR